MMVLFVMKIIIWMVSMEAARVMDGWKRGQSYEYGGLMMIVPWIILFILVEKGVNDDPSI